MKHVTKITLFSLMIALMIVFGLTQAAVAGGTAPDTNITNQASVAYDVGGIPQTDIPSNTDDFEVDRLLDINVSEQGGSTTSVTPGQTLRVTTFRVTNEGNDTIDALVAAVNRVSTTVDPHGGNADSFDITSLNVFVDTNDDDAYTDGVDTDTFIDDLAADANIEVFVVGTVPIDLANGVVSVVTLTGTIADAAGSPGAASTEDSDGNDDAVVENVFGDDIGDTDAEDDGKDSDSDSFTVSSVDLVITKTSTVYWDPQNALVSPYPIPGAIITYTITVDNSAGSEAAASVVISDTVDTANVNIVTQYEQYSGPATCAAGEGIYINGSACNTNAVGGPDDDAEFAGNVLTARLGTVAAGATETVSYQVEIK